MGNHQGYTGKKWIKISARNPGVVKGSHKLIGVGVKQIVEVEGKTLHLLSNVVKSFGR